MLLVDAREVGLDLNAAHGLTEAQLPGAAQPKMGPGLNLSGSLTTMCKSLKYIPYPILTSVVSHPMNSTDGSIGRCRAISAQVAPPSLVFQTSARAPTGWCQAESPFSGTTRATPGLAACATT